MFISLYLEPGLHMSKEVQKDEQKMSHPLKWNLTHPSHISFHTVIASCFQCVCIHLYFSILRRSSNKLTGRSQVSGCLVCGSKCDIERKSRQNIQTWLWIGFTMPQYLLILTKVGTFDESISIWFNFECAEVQRSSHTDWSLWSQPDLWLLKIF